LIILLSLMGCSASDSIAPQSNISLGGSTATFAISDDYLYSIDERKLTTFYIGDEAKISKVADLNIDVVQLETIFPKGDFLFLGSTTGVIILDISVRERPVYLSEYQHVVSCDPVIVDGSYAFSTLRSGNNCGQSVDELQIIDISNITRPQLITSYPMTSPKGLAANGDYLYICDNGVKVYDKSDVNNLILLNHIRDIPANDLIYFNNQLLVTANDGFYQFNTSNGIDFTLLSQFAY
jgi:hypothetical protein